MWRIRSAVPWHILLFLALLLVAAWQAEGLLLQVLVGNRLAQSALVAATAGATGAVAATNDFFSYGLAALQALISQAFSRLPESVRDALPTGAFHAIGRGLALLFGWHAWLILFSSIVALVGEAFRFLLALNLAGWTYNLLRRVGRQLARAVMMPVRFYSENDASEEEGGAPGVPAVAGRVGQRRKEYIEFFASHVRNIGIILPGGGARGVYQAGAFKAVYDFLRDYNALGKVRVIVGTSTGAWNAMFWMAGLMEPGRGPADLENWWKKSKFSRLMEFPRLWVPFISEHYFSLKPWREQFVELFGGRLDHLFSESAPLHFYLTRTDVRLGMMRYVTNWSGLKQRAQTLGVENQDGYRMVDLIGPDGQQYERMQEAVFGSLGQAPLFPGFCDGTPSESGDAVDPIPLRFAASLEDCDLIFVLPARGAPEKLGDSREARLSRMLHVQQLALERFTIKGADMVNRVAERFDRLEFGATTIASAAGIVGVAAEAASGVREEIDEFCHAYKRLYIFTATPWDKLAVGVFDYGREREATAGFDLMYTRVSEELRHRLFDDIEPEDAHVVMIDGLVSTKGEPVKPTYRRPSHF